MSGSCTVPDRFLSDSMSSPEKFEPPEPDERDGLKVVLRSVSGFCMVKVVDERRRRALRQVRGGLTLLLSCSVIDLDPSSMVGSMDVADKEVRSVKHAREVNQRNGSTQKSGSVADSGSASARAGLEQ